MSEWISVKDRLPIQMPENWPTMDWVLVCSCADPKPVAIARYDGEKWEFLCTNDSWAYGACLGDCTHALDIDDITHWTPLPKPPGDL